MPKVLRSQVQSNAPSSKEPGDFPVRQLSASSMISFSTNPILFKINYVNRDRFDTATGASGVLGKAVHKALEVYYVGSDTLIPTNESEAIEYGLRAGMEFLELYNDGFINYTKTIPNKQKLFDLLTFCFQAYIKEMPHKPDSIVACEDGIEEAIDIEWKGQRLTLPIPLKGYLDKVWKGEDGKVRITDYKTCYAYSNPEKIDGAKILQAVVYYLLAYAKYGEEPHSVTFEEVKYSKNSDGSKQVRSYEIVFAENELFFDFFFRFYEDVVRGLNGEQVYVPNVHALFDNEVAIIAYIHRLDDSEETARLMKKHKVRNVSDLLKKQIASAGNMRKLMKTVEAQFVSAKNLDYDKMKNHEKIQTKMMEHGMMLQYEDVIEGSTVDMYRYTPSIGLKMARIGQFVADVEQVLGVTGVRVLAPIPGTSYIGFEVPRAVRSFPALPGKSGSPIIAVGETLTGEARHFDVREAPHILVAGASGSGKSVWLSNTIGQLEGVGELYLFDPKRVELSHFKASAARYEHDADKICVALAELVVEMGDRYGTLEEKGLKNIDGSGLGYKFVVIDEFQSLATQNPEGSEEWTLCKGHQDWNDSHGGELERLLRTSRKLRVKEQEAVDQVKFCDECTKTVIPPFEASLMRLAAEGRAAGIHIIIATQSPRATIINGAIKANFPVKVAFKTSKAVESLVVLDEPGAEKLLGKGDMLFAGDAGIERLQAFAPKH